MKYKIVFMLALLSQLQDKQPPSNPRYDFPTVLTKQVTRTFSYYDRVMNDLSIAEYYRASRLYEDSSFGIAKPIVINLVNKKIIGAKQFILEEARKYRVLMINESHIRPQHRLFTKSLLKELKREGYNVLMAEGISMKNTIALKGYPTSSDGDLINEPNYASMLRYARQLGYKICAYEQYTSKKNYWDDSVKLDQYGSIKYISYEPRDSAILTFDKNGLQNTYYTSVRERAQAENILATIRKNPSSKFIIHVGAGHLYESGSMMGAKLKELLHNEDFLTIDQEVLTDQIPVIDAVTGDTLKRSFPFLLWDSAKNEYFNPLSTSQVDYSIFNASVTDSLSRPVFLFQDVEPRTVFKVQMDQLKDCPCVLSAYYSHEYKKEGPMAIAIDNVYCDGSQDNPPLLLYKGNYTIVKRNRRGELFNFTIVVK